MGQALTLYESLVTHHPEVEFHVALCDNIGNLDKLSFPFRIIELEHLGIPQLSRMKVEYNITELNTSIKPFIFDVLHEDRPNDPVVYFDPDILILNPLTELMSVLSEGAECVLTPHMTQPCEWAEMHEGRLLQYGAYNLGFLALRGSSNVRRIARWWGRRLESQCLIDLNSGLFVDQKWADLFPSFIERTHILRHPGYNVAYWNLSTRRVSFEDDRWWVNEMPLRFFHFSGALIDDTTVFSRHSSFYVKGGLRNVDTLFEQYCATVKRNGLFHYRKEYPYSFDWGGKLGRNDHTPKEIFCSDSRSSSQQPSICASNNRPHLPVMRASSYDEFRQKSSMITDIQVQRRQIEHELVPETDPFHVSSYCSICEKNELMTVSSMYSSGKYSDGRSIPNWREHLECTCGFVNRLRATLHILLQELDPNPGDCIYLTEQATPLFDWFSDNFDNVYGSEYFGSSYLGGENVNGYRHEDVQELSFPDNSFDLTLSLEVLEHVPFPDRAFRELRRCTRDGGAVVITVPFSYDSKTDIVRARIGDTGEIEHLMEAEYHGNPVDPINGALCYRYFGWDILDRLRANGFLSAEVLFYWSRKFGYLGSTNAVILARA